MIFASAASLLLAGFASASPLAKEAKADAVDINSILDANKAILLANPDLGNCFEQCFVNVCGLEKVPQTGVDDKWVECIHRKGLPNILEDETYTQCNKDCVTRSPDLKANFQTLENVYDELSDDELSKIEDSIVSQYETLQETVREFEDNEDMDTKPKSDSFVSD